MPLYFFYILVQKVKNDQKLKTRGPALNKQQQQQQQQQQKQQQQQQQQQHTPFFRCWITNTNLHSYNLNLHEIQNETFAYRGGHRAVDLSCCCVKLFFANTSPHLPE